MLRITKSNFSPKAGGLFLLVPSLFFVGIANAHPDNYEDFEGTSGCRLMLCMQNPNGPMTVSACQQDVGAFFTELALAYYPGHNVSIPICTPSLTNGSFFTVGEIQKCVLHKDHWVYRKTGNRTVSTFIGNESWKDWFFELGNNNIGEFSENEFNQAALYPDGYRIVPFTSDGTSPGGPYLKVLPEKYKTTKFYTHHGSSIKQKSNRGQQNNLSNRSGQGFNSNQGQFDEQKCASNSSVFPY